MYTNITEQSNTLDAMENELGTCHAEQAAYLYEDQLEDEDQFNVTALREIEAFCDDLLNVMEDKDAEYIRNQAHSQINKLTDKVRVQLVEKLEAEGKTIKMEMSLDAMIALAVGSERVELLPSRERFERNLKGAGDTPNERALCTNMVAWIEMSVEAARALINAKQRAAKLEQRCENAEMRLKLIDHKLTKQQHETVKLMQVADGRADDQVVFDEGEDAKLWDF